MICSNKGQIKSSSPCLFVLQGKHWPCLQSLAHTSGHSLSDVPKAAQGQSEDEAETVSAMASLSVDVEQQQASALNSMETSRSAALCDAFIQRPRENQAKCTSLHLMCFSTTIFEIV